MGSKWKKIKLAIGTGMCLHISRSAGDETPSNDVVPRSSGTRSPAGRTSDRRPTTPNSSSSTLRVSKSGSRSAKRLCAICLTTMKTGKGHAIFTAECSHSFHFHCITSNVKHGNQICPVCRAKWKEIPFKSSSSDLVHARLDARMNGARQLPPQPPPLRRPIMYLFHGPEPLHYDDDEAIDLQPAATTSNDAATVSSCFEKLGVKTYPETSAVPRSVSHDNFSVLVHLKAPLSDSRKRNHGNEGIHQQSRAPVDLVTVLDISGSMAGTKLALLKRAMGFVIQNLGPSDRLSVVSFSSLAHRLFPLCRMTDAGKQRALQAVNSLTSNGGTNITEGLRKGGRVLLERKFKNPVGSIILLSDGQDTYVYTGPSNHRPQINYNALLPLSIQRSDRSGLRIPVHSFGFGVDHDAVAMHSISDATGGTFSFIEAEHTIQDAFAQCIGGLLSVVVQDLQVEVGCIHPNLQLSSIQAGSYQTRITENRRKGSIHFGDLYAEEERDCLVVFNIPVDGAGGEVPLLKVRCVYKDPITKELVNLDDASEVQIQRPDAVGEQVVSLEVDRQRNRLGAAEAISEARVSAEDGDFDGAVSVLDRCYKSVSESASARAGDRLCEALCAEMKEMQERMRSRQAYEASGRAYVLSGLSSHSWQRATARGDSVETGSVVQTYQTPSMVDMVSRSQIMSPAGRTLRSAHSFPAKIDPQ